jgi:hypothetical protein
VKRVAKTVLLVFGIISIVVGGILSFIFGMMLMLMFGWEAESPGTTIAPGFWISTYIWLIIGIILIIVGIILLILSARRKD